MDRHISDNTRTVLPRHPPGETGESTASSSFPHQALPSEAPTTVSRLGDEYAHFAWGPDLGLGAASALASPLYTLVDRCTIQVPNGFWEWRYRGHYLNGSLSGFITGSECLDSFSPMELDVFYALWELYQPPRHRTQPAAESTRTERLAANRAHALLEVPIGTVVWRDFTDQREGSNVAGPKSMTTKLHTGGFGTRMETGKS